MSSLRHLEALRSGLVRSTVLVGLASLGLMGPVGLRFSLGALALVAGCWALRGRPAREDLWKISNALVSAATLVVPILFPVSWQHAGMALLVYLQVHRARTGHRPRDDRFALLFALLMVLLASGDSRSPWLGLVLLLLTGLLPVALLVLNVFETEQAHGVRREALGAGGRSTLLVLLAPASVLCTTAFFLVIPRLNAEVLAEYGREQEVSGFSGELTLGELGEIKNNYEVVFNAEVRDHQGGLQRGPFYFRGIALDHFDGNRWTAVDTSSQAIAPELPTLDEGLAGPGQLYVRILMEPFRANAGQGGGVPLFSMSDVERVVSDERVWRDTRAGYRFDAEPRRREYALYVRPPLQVPGKSIRVPRRVRATALQLPSDLDPRIAELAHQVAGEVEDPWAKTARLEQYLHDAYDYTLIPETGNVGQPLSIFLFDSRRGHCEYFATALAVMLRSEGVPARIVNGFYTDEFNPVGGFTVARQAHAHSWVEAWIQGRWVRFDATPAGVMSPPAGGLSQIVDALEARWYGLIVDYDLAAQLSGVRSVGRALGPQEGPQESPLPAEAVGAGVVALGFGSVFLALGLVMRRLVGARTRTRRLTGVEAVHARARKLVARRGWEVPTALPPVEAAQWLRKAAGDEAAPLEELAWLHYRALYTGQEGTEQQARDLLRALAGLPSARSAG